MSLPYIDITGQRFGRLLVLRRLNTVFEYRERQWLVRCDCGCEKPVTSGTLRYGGTQSCGCLRRERFTARHTTHGYARTGPRSPEYQTWRSMITRCTNPRTSDWKRYGGRGITVCDRWRHDFPAFLSDMGPRPSRHTIDRIDPDGNYTPENCRWADALTQRHNRRRKHSESCRAEERDEAYERANERHRQSQGHEL